MRVKQILKYIENPILYVCKYSLILLILKIILIIIFGIVDFFHPINFGQGISVFGKGDLQSEIANVLIFIPFFETLLFQVIPIKLLYKRINNKWIIILISAFCFGLSHYYSIFYILWTSLFGVVFAYAYLDRLERKSNPFLIVVSIHCIFNLITLLFEFLLYKSS